MPSRVTRIVGNVPSPRNTAAFIGRRAELDAVKAAFADTRLVTVIGPPGVGKTRLAVEFGRGAGRAYQHGVWLVDLAPNRDDGLVASAIANVLGVHDSAQSTVLATLVAHLRPLRALLVLDNAEHLINGVTAAVTAILDAAPGVRIVVTSRVALGVEDERVVTVPPLDVPPASTPVTPADRAGVSEYDAVRLLSARARDAGLHEFATTADPALVTRLCQRVDGLPLALVLAAGWLYSMSLADVVDHLDQFVLRPRTDHHRTMHDCIEISHRLSTEAERKLWARLSVFSGGFALADAVAVCADDQAGTIDSHTVIDLLHRLVQHSIVERQHHGSETWYRLLEPVRVFAQSTLAETGPDAIARWRQRHAMHYRNHAKRAAAERYSPRPVDVVSTLRRQMPDMRAALDWCVDQTGADEAQTALELVIALSQATCWFSAATVAEGRGYLIRALEMPDCKPSLLRVQAAMYVTWCAVLQADPDAGTWVDRCRHEAQRYDAEGAGGPAHAYAHYAAGLRELFNERSTAAIAMLEQAVAGFQAADIPGMLHLASLYLALAGLRFGDMATADQASRRCWSNAERHGDVTTVSWARWTRGLVELELGHTAAARDRFRRSLREMWALGAYWGTELMVDTLARAAAEAGQDTYAAQLLGVAATFRGVAGPDGVGLATYGEPHAQALAIITQRLPQDQIDAAFSRGRRLSPAEALALALGQSEPARRGRAAPSRPRSPLPRQQAAVADLIVLGCTNSEIAETLCIDVRTVETHVSRAMKKAGVRNRVALARWWQQHRPHQVNT